MIAKSATPRLATWSCKAIFRGVFVVTVVLGLLNPHAAGGEHDLVSLQELREQDETAVPAAIATFCQSRAPADLAELIELATHPELVRWHPAELVFALQASATPETWSQIASLLDHDHAITRYVAVKAAMGMAEAPARAALLKMLDAGHSDVRARAAMLLRFFPNEATSTQLSTMATEGQTAAERIAAQASLRWIKDEAAKERPISRVVRLPAKDGQPTPEVNDAGVIVVELPGLSLSQETRNAVLARVAQGATLWLKGAGPETDAAPFLKGLKTGALPKLVGEKHLVRCAWKEAHPLQDWALSGDAARLGLDSPNDNTASAAWLSAATRIHLPKAPAGFVNWDQKLWSAPWCGLQRPDLAPVLTAPATAERGMVIVDCFPSQVRFWEYQRNLAAFVEGPRAINALKYFSEYREWRPAIYFDQVSMDVVTPHVPWAKPLAGGAVKTTFLLSERQLRTSVEIRQRCELSATYIPFTNFNFGPPKAKNRRGLPVPSAGTEMAILRELRQPPEAMVVSGLQAAPMGTNAVEAVYHLDALQHRTQLAIMKAVREGMGLVVLGNKGLARLMQIGADEQETPEAIGGCLPGAEDDERIRCYTLGKGRVVHMRIDEHYVRCEWQLPDAFAVPWLDDQLAPRIPAREYIWAANAAAIAWVAKRDVDADGSQEVVQLRDRFNRVHKPTATLVGPHIREVRKLDATGKVVSWRAEAVLVVSPPLSVTLTPRVVEPNANMQVKVANASGQGSHVQIVVRDAFNRVVHRSKHEVAAATDISIPIDWQPVSRIHDCDVAVLRDAQEVANASLPFCVTYPQPDDKLKLYIASHPYGLIPGMQAMGASFVVDDDRWSDVKRAHSWELALRAGLQPQGTFSTLPSNMQAKSEWNDGVRSNCFSDPALWSNFRNSLWKLAPTFNRFGIDRCFMVDEFHLGKPFCFSKHCMNRFRMELRQQYADLAALNDAWRTKFTTWDAVVPDTLKAATKKGVWASWMAHREFMDSRVANWAEETERQLRAVGPRTSKTGFSSYYFAGAELGLNTARLCRASSHMVTHRKVYRVQELQDLGGPDMGAGRWFAAGYDRGQRSGGKALYELGSYLIDQCRAIHYWWGWVDFEYPLLRPDLTVTDYLKPFAEELAFYHRGIDRLFLTADRENHQVATLYSQPSLRMVHALNTAVEGKIPVVYSQSAALKLIRPLGVQGRILSYLDVEEGKLDKLRDLRLLALVGCLALSDAEVAAIERFVGRGGVLFADCLPGVYDELGHARTDNPLATLFGVKSGFQPKAIGDPSALELQAPIFADIANVQAHACDDGLSVTEGKAMATIGAVPGLVVRDHGKGQTILLNASISRLENGAAFRDALGRFLLQRASLQAPVTLTNGDGQRFEADLRTHRFGAGRLVGIMRRGSSSLADSLTHKVRVRFPESMHVYSLRSEQHWAGVKELTTDITDNRAGLFAAYPAPLPPLQVNGKPGIGDGVATIALKAGVEPRVIALRVTDANGKQRPELARSVTVQGMYSLAVPIALNDAGGTWTAHLEDVITGQKLNVEYTR